MHSQWYVSEHVSQFFYGSIVRTSALALQGGGAGGPSLRVASDLNAAPPDRDYGYSMPDAKPRTLSEGLSRKSARLISRLVFIGSILLFSFAELWAARGASGSTSLNKKSREYDQSNE